MNTYNSQLLIEYRLRRPKSVAQSCFSYLIHLIATGVVNELKFFSGTQIQNVMVDSPQSAVVLILTAWSLQDIVLTLARISGPNFVRNDMQGRANPP